MSDTAPRPARPDAQEPGAALVFDDPLARPSRDDTDEGWGGDHLPPGGGAAELARLLDEKPPHHL